MAINPTSATPAAPATRSQTSSSVAAVQCGGDSTIQRGDQSGAVDGMSGVRPVGDRPRFVALDMSDHVPAHRFTQERGHVRGFGGGFLFAGLAK
jgi:hypothetical protein